MEFCLIFSLIFFLKKPKKNEDLSVNLIESCHLKPDTVNKSNIFSLSRIIPHQKPKNNTK